VSTRAAWLAWRDRLGAKLVDPLQSDEVRRRAALVLLDDLAAMVVGHRTAEVRAFADLVGAAGGEARLLTSRGAASRERAATVNAVAAAWDELDEGYRPATAHGGLYAVPAVIAEAEATGAGLDDVLAAIVVGYEVATGVARAFPSPRPLLLHPHATHSPIGAAAALAWLRTGDAGAVLAAADVAATLSMPAPFRLATAGAQVRNLWAGAGASAGFLAASAAQAGLGSDPGVVPDVFADTYGYRPDEQELATGPEPGRWAILDGYHKLYAACQYTHSALEAAAEVAGRLGGGVDPAQVSRVDVRTHPLALPLDDVSPSTSLGGKFSVPHVVATVLATGRTDVEVFSGAYLSDPAVAALRPRVHLAPYEPLPAPPHDRPAAVELLMVDGTRWGSESLSAVGGPDRPLSVDDVLDKVATLTAPSLPRFAGVARGVLSGDVAGSTAWSDVLDALLEGGHR